MTRKGDTVINETKSKTREQLLAERFTGRIGEAYYYKGVRWFGPTNLIGRKPFLTDGEGPSFGYYRGA